MIVLVQMLRKRSYKIPHVIGFVTHRIELIFVLNNLYFFMSSKAEVYFVSCFAFTGSYLAAQ